MWMVAIDFLCELCVRPEMTWFKYGDRLTCLLCRWLKSTCFAGPDRKWLDFCEDQNWIGSCGSGRNWPGFRVPAENDFVFVWVNQKDLFLCSWSRLTCFLCSAGNDLDISVEIDALYRWTKLTCFSCGWSKLTSVWCAGRKWLGFSPWWIEIDFISVRGRNWVCKKTNGTQREHGNTMPEISLTRIKYLRYNIAEYKLTTSLFYAL